MFLHSAPHSDTREGHRRPRPSRRRAQSSTPAEPPRPSAARPSAPHSAPTGAPSQREPGARSSGWGTYWHRSHEALSPPRGSGRRLLRAPQCGRSLRLSSQERSGGTLPEAGRGRSTASGYLGSSWGCERKRRCAGGARQSLAQPAPPLPLSPSTLLRHLSARSAVPAPAPTHRHPGRTPTNARRSVRLLPETSLSASARGHFRPARGYVWGRHFRPRAPDASRGGGGERRSRCGH